VARAHLYLAVLLIAALAAGGVALAAGGGSSKTLTACAAKKGGALRLVASGKRCRKRERRVAWNRAGRPGPVGLQGPKGDVGAADTSAFYTRGETDARFQRGVAVSTGAPVTVAEGSAGDPQGKTVLDIPGFGRVLVFGCGNPSPGVSIAYRNTSPVAQRFIRGTSSGFGASDLNSGDASTTAPITGGGVQTFDIASPTADATVRVAGEVFGGSPCAVWATATAFP
jgi:hypothetical protein